MTKATFQAAFSASGTPELRPRAPNGRHEVGPVAGHEETTGDHLVDLAGVEAIDRLPHDLVVGVADDLADPGLELAGCLLGGEVVVRRDLPVDPVGRVGAGVDEDLPAGVPLRVEVEPALELPARQASCGCRR
jgi:hypothetical protein